MPRLALPLRVRWVLAWCGVLVAVWVLLGLTAPGQQLGYEGLVGGGWGRGLAGAPLRAAVWLGSPVVTVCTVVLAVVVASARRQWHRGWRAGLLGLGVAAAAQVLQHLLPHVETGWFPHWNTLPSGHAAGYLGAVLATLLVLPGRRRSLVPAAVALVGGGTLVGAGLLATTAHVLADVLASFALAGAGLALLAPVTEPHAPACPALRRPADDDPGTASTQVGWAKRLVPLRRPADEDPGTADTGPGDGGPRGPRAQGSWVRPLAGVAVGCLLLAGCLVALPGLTGATWVHLLGLVTCAATAGLLTCTVADLLAW